GDAEELEDGKGNGGIQNQGQAGDHTRQPVVEEHEQDDNRQPEGAGQQAELHRRRAQSGADLAGRRDGDRTGQRTGVQLYGQCLGAGRGKAAGDDARPAADLALNVGILNQVLVDEDGDLVFGRAARVTNAITRERTEPIAPGRVKGEGDIREVRICVGRAAGTRDHAAVDVGELRFVALVFVGVSRIQLQILDGFGVGCPRYPLEDSQVGGLSQDLLRLLQVDPWQFDDDAVGALRPDHRLGVATAV